MRVLEASLSNLTYSADFGRIEAKVSLLVKLDGQPPRQIRVNTSQPLRGAQPLQDRLISDAILLAGQMRFGHASDSAQPDLPIAA